jgi:hypothetical protein
MRQEFLVMMMLLSLFKHSGIRCKNSSDVISFEKARVSWQDVQKRGPTIPWSEQLE